MFFFSVHPQAHYLIIVAVVYSITSLESSKSEFDFLE